MTANGISALEFHPTSDTHEPKWRPRVSPENTLGGENAVQLETEREEKKEEMSFTRLLRLGSYFSNIQQQLWLFAKPKAFASYAFVLTWLIVT